MRRKNIAQLNLFGEEPEQGRKRRKPVYTRDDTTGILAPTLPTPTFTWRQIGEEPNGAWATADGKHRLLLWRSWSSAPRALFAMLNPSTADASDDDPTIRRCVAFAQGWGCGGILVVNLYSLIESDSKRLWDVEPEQRLAPADALGSAASTHAEVYDGAVARCLGDLVVAWGAIAPGAHKRVEELLGVCARRHRSVRCLGTTRQGHPRHPLYLAGSTPLESFSL